MVEIRIRDTGVGSGFVVEGGYIVTAAHVAWPYTALGIVFEDGTEYANVPVVSYDHLADLAFLGPIDTAAPHVELANIETVSEGDTVFVFGYPEERIGLSFTNGEFEYTWNWADADIKQFLSTPDAEFGMSGGPMTNADGEVIGVLVRGDDTGSIGTSSNTIQYQLFKTASGEEVSPAGSRPLPAGKGSYEHDFVLRGRSDTETFIFRDHSDTPFSIEFDAARDVEFALFDQYGDAAIRSVFRSTGIGIRNSTWRFDGTWFVVVKQQYDLEREVKIKSSVPLVRYHDPDDGRHLRPDDTVAAVFDTPGDIDTYTIDLKAGQRIGIRFQSNDLTQVTIDYPDAAPYETVLVEGNYEEIEYRASVDVEYTIALQPTGGIDGYTLSIFDTAASGRGKPDDSIEGPAGDMLRHTFQHSPPTIHIDYPVNITGGDHPEVLGAELFEQGRRGQTIALEEQGINYLRQAPQEKLSLDQLVGRSIVFNSLPLLSKRVTNRREIATPFGSSVLIEDFEAHDGDTKGVRLAYIHEGETGFMAVFYAPADVFDEWRAVVDYCIGSFAIGDFTVAGGM